MKTYCTSLAICCLLLLGCHLEKLSDSTDCTGPKPKADFALSVGSCDLPCTNITITDQSENAKFYVWKVNGRQFSTSRTPPAQSFSIAGQQEIRLVVTSDGGCKDSIAKFVTVGSISRFKKIISEASTASVVALYATQRSGGDYHCLFNQNGLKSIIVTNDGRAIASPIPLNASISTSYVIPFRGGFVVSRSNGNNAEVQLINASQTSPSSTPFHFGNATKSTGWAIATGDGGNSLVLSGHRNEPTPLMPGFARFNTSLTVQGTPVVISDGTTFNNFSGGAMVQRPNGTYLVAAYNLDLLKPVQLITTGNQGAFLSKIGLPLVTTPIRMIQLEGDLYALIGRDGAALPNFYILILDGNGTVLASQPFTGWTSVRDVVHTSGNRVVVCGTKSGAMTAQKFGFASNAITRIWSADISYNESVGSSNGISVSNTADGGLIFYGHYINGGLSLPYLVKTDAEGR
jgi:PKD repeat protein